MKRNTDRVTRRRLLLAAGYGLSSSLFGATAHAGKCESGKAGCHTSGYSVQSALPFVGYRYIPASNGVIHKSDPVMFPSPRNAFVNAPDPDALVRGDKPDLPTTDLSEETAL